jgi:hypothetical protein
VDLYYQQSLSFLSCSMLRNLPWTKWEVGIRIGPQTPLPIDDNTLFRHGHHDEELELCKLTRLQLN